MSFIKNIRLYLILVLLFLAGIWLFSGSTAVSESFLKGMTVSCQTWGYEWATPEMKETMIELKSLGANSISIHPYARIFEDGRIRYKKSRQVDHIKIPTSWGKELNIQVMIKPHLAYWGTKFRWRGDIDFENDEDWDNFFRDYTEWIVTIASISERSGARLFCVGTELMNSLKFENEWRKIISEIRRVYSGKLTYAANWDKYDKVSFWDDLDFIGIQAYFPLADHANPSAEEIKKGWNRVYKELIPYADGLNKQILFTEIGYDISENAAKKPWRPGSVDYRRGDLLQQLCLRIALDEAKDYKQLAGLFLWKWFPETQAFEHYENYNLQRPEIKSLLKEMWGE